MAQSLTVKIVEAIADRAGVDETDLPPLHDVIDPDALEALFIPASPNANDAAQIRFQYYGYRVTVSADGSVTVE